MTRTVILLAVAGAIVSATPALAEVRVTFINAAEYRDRDFRNPKKRETTLDAFRRFFRKLGKQYLQPGEVVTLEVLDIDLAGDFEPGRRHLGNVRIMDGITPPRFKMRFRLTVNGRIISQGEESIVGTNYLMGFSARNSSDTFAFEKQMLRRWFRKRFSR